MYYIPVLRIFSIGEILRAIKKPIISVFTAVKIHFPLLPSTNTTYLNMTTNQLYQHVSVAMFYSSKTITFIRRMTFIAIMMLLLALPEKTFAVIAQRGSTTTGTNATTATNITINKPTGVVSGDVMIAAFAS